MRESPLALGWTISTVGILCLLFPAIARAQDAGPVPDQSEINRRLMERIDQLEKEVQALKAQPAAPASPPSSPGPAPAPTPQTVPVVEEAPEVNEVAPRLKLNIFGDVGLQGYNGSDTTFFLGSFDLLTTARLSDKVAVLGELLFLPEITDNAIGVDVERLLLTYRPSDYFHISIGRYHTWVGYYNTAFNRGEFFETSTDRPFVFAFDDFGGVLPMQDVGATATGKIPTGKLGLNWIAEVGNGRAWGINVEPAQNRQDSNTSKAVNLGLFMRPEKFSGLQLGFSVRHDNLSIPGPAIHELITAAHVVFTNTKYEILNEVALDQHLVAGGPIFNTTGGYTQWSRRFGNVRPYVRYQFFNAPNNDPVFVYAPPNDLAPQNYTAFVSGLSGPSAGIRYNFTAHSALKFQYDRFYLRGLPDENGLTGQVAFTF